MKRVSNLVCIVAVWMGCWCIQANAQSGTLEAEAGWWMTPHRLVQTNLREIDATMDTDQYVREVQDFGANIVLFNVGGIVANYPTDHPYHWQNTFMQGDLVGETLEKLHAADIQMIGRFDFSKVNEQYAKEHPEWLFVGEEGEHVNYNGQMHTCIMGDYQQKHALEILEEALTNYPLDGVFFNMIGFPTRDYSRIEHGYCQCANCAQSFRTFCGMSLPKRGGDADAVEKYEQWKRIQIDNQFEAVRQTIKSIRPQTVICTYTTKFVDVIRKESNHALGQKPWTDVDRAQWTLLTSGGKQLANAAVHFYQMIFRHAGAGAYLQPRRLWQQMVNGAWLDFYCIGPLQRLEDRASIGPISDIYQFHAVNEEWLLQTESAAEVGLVRHDGEDYWGWVQILSENRIPYELVSFNNSELSRYKAVIVPASGRLAAADSRSLDDYVRAGGQLVLSGRIPEAMESLGRPTLKKTWPGRHSMYVRIRPGDKSNLDEPELKDYDLVQLRGDFYEYEPSAGTETKMHLIHDVMYGPPEKCYIVSESDIPALLVKRFGRGMAAALPYQLGAMYREWGNQGHSKLASGVLKNILASNLRLNVECSPLVEVTHRADPGGHFEWIALYNHSGRVGNSFHKPIPMRDITIDLKTSRSVKQVRLLKDKTTLSVRTDAADAISITVPELEVFEIVLVEYE